MPVVIGPTEFVYFIQQGPGGPIKIGRTRDLVKRFRVLQSSSGIPLSLEREIEIDAESASALEFRLHCTFAEERIGGEWFSPSERLKAFIASDEAWPPPLPI